jgi:hypothetical protein
MLKNEGIMFLMTHGHMIYHPAPEDYWRWTKKGLKKEIENSGFKIKEFNGIMSRASTGGQFILDSLRPNIPSIFHGIANLFMQGVIALLDRDVVSPKRNKDACVFLVVAEK